MSNPSLEKFGDSDFRAKEAQLIISLKFHHASTLAEIPLEVAVSAIAKVWESCQNPGSP
ncbi:hypothetical protein [Lyngbya confervoides]|uniref:Uncharacterized protein n=1 Tax=Lyngbya confervoides BDU141951 TaxID=1574623 RepID=A0ABD4SYI6_9CYAN|nr:hypothetical protein [Lyngbya confervoides]MCM1981516.1 hypothetical protein [Lyngbya confervoides BDU141951]